MNQEDPEVYAPWAISKQMMEDNDGAIADYTKR